MKEYEKNKVSVVLVNYKTKNLLRDCINSINEKTLDVNFDIYVVDNNSQDGSCEMIREEFPNVKLIENPLNSGFGAANNLGIKESDSEYIFLLNSDTLLVNNAIKILRDFLNKNQKVGACGGNLYDEEMNHVHSYGIMPKLFDYIVLSNWLLRPFFKEIRKKKADKGLNEKDELKSVDYITGADLMIRKSVLDEVGAFDESFFLYFEETELEFRVRKAGHEIFIVPDAKIIHLHDKSPKKKGRKYFEFLKSRYLFFKLCYGTKRNIFFIKLLMIFTNLYKIFSHPICIFNLFGFIIKDRLR